MAEFVEFRAEEWILELEQMERIHLFESKEIKTIATKRREFEYKLQRKTKSKEDYLKYIQFELDLHRLIKARREKTNITEKKAEIEYSQTNRISKLFKQAIFRFQSDIKLWLSFFKFCEEVNLKSPASQMLVRMLQIHTDKPDLWVFAAKWEFEQCKSIENARELLTRGLRFHPSSDIIYKMLFKLEMEHIKMKRREKEKKMKVDEWVPDEVTENILEGKLIDVVYSSAVKNINDVKFLVSLLNEVKNYDGSEKIQNKILQQLMTDHSDSELSWDAIAKREYQGISCDFTELDLEPMEVDDEKESGEKSAKEKILRSVAVYEKAVKKLNTPKMWSLYLDHVLKFYNNATTLPLLKLKLLKNAMEAALASGNMQEKYFLQWAEILRRTGGKNKTLPEVLEKGTEQHPKSVPLWLGRLKYYLSKNQGEIGKTIFEEAIANVPNALCIWKLMIQFLQLKQPHKVDEVFENGIKRGGEIARSLKPLYLEWIANSEGLNQARKLFETIEYQNPPCLELYRKMASLEFNRPDFSPEHVRKCHELACSHFGETNSNVWLEYIKFEMKHGDVTKVDQIHRRAVKTLEPIQADEFVTEYNFIKTDGTSCDK